MGVFVTGRQVALEIPMPGWWLFGASVDLDFDSGRYYDSSTANPRAATDFLSCTRASTGYAKTSTGTLTSFASNQLRITDLGLLVEDARTNRKTASQDFSDGGNWNVLSNLNAPTADAAVAPDGTTTADKLVPNTNNSNDHRIAGAPSNAIGTGLVTWSCYFKPAGYGYAMITGSDQTADTQFAALFDLVGVSVSQTFTNFGSGPAPTQTATNIESFGNGWVRASITFNMLNSNPDFGITVFNATPRAAFAGDGTSGIYAWGAQCELGAFPSSYIPTTSTSATRAADSIAISGAAQTVIAAATGSIIAQIGTQGGINFAATIVDSNGTNVLGFNASNNALASLIATLATGNAANRSAGDDKSGLAWSGAGRSIVLNGGTVATDASAQTPSSTQKLGSANATSNFIYAYVERLTLFNSKLADATLQGFTR